MNAAELKERVTGAFKRPYWWGVLAIVVLLLINVIKDPSYLDVSYSDNLGGLVGNLVDILRYAAPTLMVAVGMSLVIARLLVAGSADCPCRPGT